ncbi:zonular occludens toxin domain-containing protein [Actinophytocola sp.]|uniref:zonular occludens toxin domain-containing protein n=1 Tax=Actinophytocola sp. TaxID=1872138 RepID=UPI0038997F81
MIRCNRCPSASVNARTNTSGGRATTRPFQSRCQVRHQDGQHPPERSITAPTNIDEALGGLLVLDEAQTFVPSRGTTASTESTLKLATQARKYGLGMVYATQAPKALHNMVTDNAATQFIGLLNASVQIQAATELARAKGGRVDDISRLPAGRFYGATEGMKMGKIQVPMCLSHHPSSACTEEEVLQRARRRSG